MSMSSRLRVKETGGPVQGPSLYDHDFAEWVQQQVRLLRAGRPANLDVPHLIEELEGLTKRDELALGSQLKRIMAHLLKQRYQPQGATRSWADSIANGREEIADILEQSPNLRHSLSCSLDTSHLRFPIEYASNPRGGNSRRRCENGRRS